MTRRLFSFIDSTDFGQTMGATFDLSIQGTITEMRLTTSEDCYIHPAVFEKKLTEQEIVKIAKGSTRDLERISKGYMLCTRRVNSLSMLNRELAQYSVIENNDHDVITYYVPGVLVDEINSGRAKYYMHNSETKSDYYSSKELELWADFYALYASIADRVVFRNILTLIPTEKNKEYENKYATKMTAEQSRENTIKKTIVSTLESSLLKAYKIEKELRRKQDEENNNDVAVGDGNNPW